MTEAEREAIGEAVDRADKALDAFMTLVRHDASLEDLYQAAKPVHEEALGIWTTIVGILRANQGLPAKAEEINLEELFL